MVYRTVRTMLLENRTSLHFVCQAENLPYTSIRELLKRDNASYSRLRNTVTKLGLNWSDVVIRDEELRARTDN